MLADEGFQFQAGQFVELRAEAAPEGCTWSIASAPTLLPRLSFFVREIPGYDANQQLLEAARKHRTVLIGAPMGKCVASRFPEGRPVLVIAGGTGIAPVHALLQAGLERPVHLYWGAGSEEELFLHQEFTAMARGSDLLTYHPVVQQPSPAWTGRVGWVHEHALADPVLREATLLVSGSPAMVRQVRQDALTRGVNAEALYSDLIDLGLLGET
jgi:CDP-4-dehydro-6-deoxyglucose reductase